MPEPDALAAALLVAAIAAGDGDASQASLAPALRARLDAVARDHAAHAARDRDAAMRALVAMASPSFAAAPSGMPARALSIVATLAPRELGSVWMRAAGPPRAGFRVSAGLRTTLARTEVTAWRA